MSTEPNSALVLIERADTKRTNVLDELRAAGAALALREMPIREAEAPARRAIRVPATPRGRLSSS